MFVNQHHLQYLLRPDHYFSDEHYQLEIERLFLPAWHFAATKSELSRSGDYLALELFGQPVLIRNCEGDFRAFQNVCAHRHCTLTRESSGNSPVLKCQYHGWEYDKTGKTARIPEARCFRPWDRENSQLVTYRLEACGDLLFVALNDEAPPLREWLNPYFESLEQEFSPPQWRMRWAWEYAAACNWKVPAENTLESYHIPSLHARSFGGLYPREESTEHRLMHRYTELNYRQTSWIELEASKVRRLLGGIPAERYTHRHIHPHTILVTTDTLNFALMYHPTSARTVTIRMRLFGFQGPRRDPFSGFCAWLTWKFGKSATVRILTEDRDVYASQQHGLEASHQPGVIGTREERIYAFHQYILKSLDLPIPHPRGQASSIADSDDAAAFHESWDNGEPIMNEIAGMNGKRNS